jgi:hypothetical protein
MFTVSPTSLTVAPGGSQNVLVTFAPSSPGAHSATLSIPHNASGSPASVVLTGVALDRTPPAAPSGLTVTSGPNQATLTWAASREPDLSHYIVYRSASPSGLENPVARVDKPDTTYKDTGLSAGTYYYRVRAVDATGNRSAASNQASVTLAPALSLSSTSLSLGNVRVGSSGTQTLIISNPGATPLTVSGIALSGADSTQFRVSPTAFTVNAGDSAKVTVTFTPTSAGTLSATLSIAHSAPANPATVRLSGVGLKPNLSHRPDRLAFTDVAVGATVLLPLTFYNSGNDTLKVDSLRVAAATGSTKEFALISPSSPPRVAPGDSQTVVVSFHPAIPGQFTGTLMASTNDPDNRVLSIPLSGTGISLALFVDLNPANGNQKLTTAGGLKPGKRVHVQLFIDDAPQIKGFTVRIVFDPEKVGLFPGSFVAGSLVPGLLGLADVKQGYIEVGGNTLGGNSGRGSGLLGSLMFEVLKGFEGETTLKIPFVVWNRVTGDQQTVQTDIRVTLTSSGKGVPTPDFNEDAKVDFDDFFLFASVFGTSSAQFDLDGDGNVGFTDFFIFAEAFGKPAP